MVLVKGKNVMSKLVTIEGTTGSHGVTRPLMDPMLLISVVFFFFFFLMGSR